jgi:uncharacterized membrane protein
MNKENDNSSSDKFLNYFIWISIGLTLLAIVFPFLVNLTFNDWSKSGTFGDTYGALNAIFSGLAFAGVIVTILIQRTELKNQRIELSLQRTEMQETRKEFLLNRTTSLVYNQLDRFEKALRDFSFTQNGETYHGNDAVSFLNENEENVNKPIDKSEDEYHDEMKAATIKLLKLYSPNKSEIEKFAHNAYNSVEVLKRLIYKTNLEIEVLNDIKNLFFVNVGFVNMGVFEMISKIVGSQLKYLQAEDYVENHIDFGVIMRANIFLKSIIEFYNLQLNKENFEEQKAKWIVSLGGQK